MLLRFVNPFTHAVSPVTLHKADLDIIDGHNFIGVLFDILLHRVRSKSNQSRGGEDGAGTRASLSDAASI